MGTTGPGGAPHMTYQALRAITGLTLNEVPYKGGGPAMTDAVGGQIPLVLTSLAAGMPHLKGNRLRGIGITAARRNPTMPDIPTFQEAGVKDFVVTHWYGFLAPAGTPRDVIEKLNREIANALTAQDVRERFSAQALDITTSNQDEFRRLLESEQQRWRGVISRTKAYIDEQPR
jgi:tripartite-type tricarboxylate transporter receptor subunit TctC